jgi:hypothetical protein
MKYPDFPCHDNSDLEVISQVQQLKQSEMEQRQEKIYQIQQQKQKIIPLDQRIQLEINNKAHDINKLMVDCDDKNTGYILSYAGYIAGLTWVLDVLKERKDDK